MENSNQITKEQIILAIKKIQGYLEEIQEALETSEFVEPRNSIFGNFTEGPTPHCGAGSKD
ncbi:hypothetical protein IAW_05025 [Bacillus cereus str. Schrouff]|uniref:hypothetical protein n=1 Tax=Bacillus cereus TaxID=1396 RepID=UPI00032EFE40|nr:hypothetical protein [Bacillus cereus]EOO05716.1 hypothetical protein IAW_05025 [Bacillus cereus str. Schrouff]EOO81858.1 hypothetical protein IGY_05569 [Bacillus cereus K-5975c]MCU4896378.1 hypothetical protein [Bacillus cereus]